MAGLYNNGFSTPFQQPYFQQPYTYQQPVQQMPSPPNPQQGQMAIHGFDWVLGHDGANAYNVPVGKTFILFDASPNSNHFFLKSTDITGKPLPAVMFDYEQHKEEPQAAASVDLSGYVPVAQFEALKKELEEIKAQPAPVSLTAEDVKELFDQMMEQRFARTTAEPKGKKAEK